MDKVLFNLDKIEALLAGVRVRYTRQYIEDAKYTDLVLAELEEQSLYARAFMSLVEGGKIHDLNMDDLYKFLTGSRGDKEGDYMGLLPVHNFTDHNSLKFLIATECNSEITEVGSLADLADMTAEELEACAYRDGWKIDHANKVFFKPRALTYYFGSSLKLYH